MINDKVHMFSITKITRVLILPQKFKQLNSLNNNKHDVCKVKCQRTPPESVYTSNNKYKL